MLANTVTLKYTKHTRLHRPHTHVLKRVQICTLAKVFKYQYTQAYKCLAYKVLSPQTQTHPEDRVVVRAETQVEKYLINSEDFVQREKV